MKENMTRGYAVLESGPVYYTNNMERTLKWFEETLGWFTVVDQREEDGAPVHGCATPAPAETSRLTLTPFTGVHLFCGEPERRIAAFIRVNNISRLYERVAQSGWTQLSEVDEKFWGGLECDVTTIDGCVIRFYQFD